MKTFVCAALVTVAFLTACNQQNSPQASAKQSEAPFPVLTIDELLNLNKNERAELERRCLGLSNKTCSDFKGSTFKQRDESARSSCQSAAAMDRVIGGKTQPKCEKYL